MAFSSIPGLAADDISIQLPAQGDQDWAINIRDLAFKKIAQHDHSGSGNGQPVASSGIANDSVNGTKILLGNDTYLRWQNSSAVATNVIKMAADDKLEFALQVDLFNMSNNVFLTGRNQADSANIDIVKIDGGDALEFGAIFSVAKMKQNVYFLGRNAADSADINMVKVDAQDRTLIQDSIYVGGSATLADNTAAAIAVPNVPSASTDETIRVFYKIVRNGTVETGEIEFDEDNADLIQTCSGDTSGATFTNNAGTLEYITTSTGSAATLSYVIIKL
tara:strand:- start:351 stop:1181 length:831 start_codon:yes stop_codon:yes gene_type:complete